MEAQINYAHFKNTSIDHGNEETHVGEVIAAKHARGMSCRLCIWQVEGRFVVLVDFIETKFKRLQEKSFAHGRKIRKKPNEHWKKKWRIEIK